MKWSESGFAERLEAALNRLGQTQKKFATDVLKVSESALSHWKDRSEPGYEDVLKLARGLAVRPAWLMYDDSFEPMDDEERAMLQTYRKLSDDERAHLRALLLAMAAQRTQSKKPGKRTPKGAPLVELIEESRRGVSLSHADQELISRLPQLKEVQQVEADLLEHLSVLPIGTKAWNACEAAAIQLRRLIDLQRSRLQAEKSKDLSAKPKAATRASGKSQLDHVPSLDQPLFPPEKE